MSGGHFNYAYQKVEDFCDQLEDDLRNIKKEKPEFESEYKFSKKTIKILERDLNNFLAMAKRMKDIEWVFSYDSGEDTLWDKKI